MNEKPRMNARGQTEAEFLMWYQSQEKNRYEEPALTVDMLIFSITDRPSTNHRKLPNKELQVLLVRRKDHPYLGQWAIPGGFVGIHEGLETAAARELKEETGLDEVYLEQLYTWGDNVQRDPRMRVVSVSYMALVDGGSLHVEAGDDAEEAEWFTVQTEVLEKTTNSQGDRSEKVERIQWILTGERTKLSFILSVTSTTEKTRTKTVVMPEAECELAFDHAQILHYGLERLRNKLNYTPVAFHLLPPEFSLTELQLVYETILGRPLVKAQFRRKIAPLVVETSQLREQYQHRPSKLFRFNPQWIVDNF